MPEIPGLGRRGGGWVVLQFVLMAAVALGAAFGPSWPGAVERPFAVVGVLAALAGVVLGVASGRALGSSLTPFPRPSSSGRLVERGPYRVVRHPIYSAGALVFAGVSAVFSPLAMLVTAGLVLTWALKSGVEERFLLAAYPAYQGYASRVRYRLIPRLY
ncbi:MAG: isoprenylcysteine carboxylmethyltransferase family protein [Gaiellaceae bacterium]